MACSVENLALKRLAFDPQRSAEQAQPESKASRVDFLTSRAEQLVHRLPASELARVYAVGASVPAILAVGWLIAQSLPLVGAAVLLLATPLAVCNTLWSARARVLRLARREPALWRDLERLGLAGRLPRASRHVSDR